MHDTKNIGLRVWDVGADFFEGPSLAHNFEKLDEHDHTGPPKGKKLSTESLTDGSVTGKKVAQETLSGNNIEDHTIGEKQIAGSVIVPLGSIIAWEPPPGVTEPGGLFEICDGRKWSEVNNKMGEEETEKISGNMLDMRNKFILGADPTGIRSPGPGVESGKEKTNLNHAHTVNPHTHTLPLHNHGIATDGLHSHSYQGLHPILGNYNLFMVRVKAPKGLVGEPSNQVSEVMAFRNEKLEANSEKEVPIQNNGGHNHTGATDFGGSGSTGFADTATGDSLGTISIVPQNYALIYIQRVR